MTISLRLLALILCSNCSNTFNKVLTTTGGHMLNYFLKPGGSLELAQNLPRMVKAFHTQPWLVHPPIPPHPTPTPPKTPTRPKHAAMHHQAIVTRGVLPILCTHSLCTFRIIALTCQTKTLTVGFIICIIRTPISRKSNRLIIIFQRGLTHPPRILCVRGIMK